MKETSILFQIKTLDKMIIRNFICDSTKIPTPTQMQIIDYILNNKNQEVLQKDLEKILNLRRATVSGVLHTMEKNELIIRVTDSTDTRIKKIILHNKAKKIFMDNKRKIEQIEKFIRNDISKEDLETFSKVINKMKNNIENMKL